MGNVRLNEKELEELMNDLDYDDFDNVDDYMSGYIDDFEKYDDFENYQD